MRVIALTERNEARSEVRRAPVGCGARISSAEINPAPRTEAVSQVDSRSRSNLLTVRVQRGNLGASILERFVVTLDPKNRRFQMVEGN
jgi:hypothetical protein